MKAVRYVCDGCMRGITALEIGVWADREHVLCHECREQGAEPILTAWAKQ